MIYHVVYRVIWNHWRWGCERFAFEIEAFDTKITLTHSGQLFEVALRRGEGKLCLIMRKQKASHVSVLTKNLHIHVVCIHVPVPHVFEPHLSLAATGTSRSWAPTTTLNSGHITTWTQASFIYRDSKLLCQSILLPIFQMSSLRNRNNEDIQCAAQRDDKVEGIQHPRPLELPTATLGASHSWQVAIWPAASRHK